MTRSAARLRWIFALACAFVVFSPLLRAEFLVVTFDDDAFVLENPSIRELDWDSVRSWFGRSYHADYVPVTLASFALDHALWGLEPRGYHLTNILLHLCVGTLVYLLVFLSTRRAEVALLAGTVFLLHPLQLEAVAIVSQRKTLLATAFALLSCLAFRRSLVERPAVWRAISLALFLLGLLAKPSVLPLPLLFFLLDPFFPRASTLREKLPFFLVAISVLLVQLSVKAGSPVVKEPHGGSALATLLLMGRVWLEYLLAMVLPLDLAPAYYYRPSLAYSAWHAAALVVVAALHALAWTLRRRFWLPCFALFWFTISMLPVSNVVPIAVVRADRYVYFAMVGFAWAAGEVLGRPGPLRRSLRPGVVFYALLVLLGAWTGSRTSVWRSDVTAWERVVERHPWNARARFLLGRAYFSRGEVGEALRAWRKASLLDPTFDAPRRELLRVARGDTTPGARGRSSHRGSSER
ncbi:MAG: membrane protein [Candidatus Binatia bacterium]|nr:MAG: membrane protein [Candidatus Binatia bacterium]